MGEDVKLMAEWLRKGATMLSEHCPACNSPLFKLHEEVWCAKCNRRVVIIKKEEEAPKITGPMLLASTEETVLTKVQEITTKIKTEQDPERLQQLGNLLSTWLEALEKLKKIQRAT